LGRKEAEKLEVKGQFSLLEFDIDSHLQVLRQMHQKERFRILRDEKYYQLSLDKPPYFEGKPFGVFLASQKDKPVAYLIPNASEWGCEFGGAPDGVRFLLRECCPVKDGETLRVTLPEFSPLFNELAQIAASQQSEGDMYRLVNWQGLLQQINTISESEIKLLGKEIISRKSFLLAKLTELILGNEEKKEHVLNDFPEEVKPVLNKIPPLTFYLWGLDHV